MKTIKALLATSAALLVGVGIAQAGPANLSSIVYSPITVTVWSGNGTPFTAALPAPTTAPFAQFTYTGPIDFATSSSTNTFGQFGFSTSNISGFSGSAGSVANFLATTMSTSGFVDNSYLEFMGMYSTGAGTMVSVTHDDGASLYTGSGYTNVVISSPAPTVAITSTGMLPAGMSVPFDLVYDEANGAPSVLDATVSGPTVPEPGTLALFGAGLAGLALFVGRRRRSNG